MVPVGLVARVPFPCILQTLTITRSDFGVGVDLLSASPPLLALVEVEVVVTVVQLLRLNCIVLLLLLLITAEMSTLPTEIIIESEWCHHSAPSPRLQGVVLRHLMVVYLPPFI